MVQPPYISMQRKILGFTLYLQVKIIADTSENFWIESINYFKGHICYIICYENLELASLCAEIVFVLTAGDLDVMVGSYISIRN